MVKDIITKNESIVPGAKELEVLKENFPACFSADGTFDFGRFKEYLNTKVAVKNEGYELRFLGKNYARLLASEDTTTVIVPNEEHNAKPENKDSKNIYISGDNLDGLKHLLKSYSRKVKCIYIDPPYNTGSDDFVYKDNFNFTVEDLSTRLSIDEEQAQRILDITKRDSNSHSAWLMFMYPRLLLARDLLSNEGVIFISIDDNEQSNLKLICDDVFGEENFIASFPRVTKRGGKSSEVIALNHDTLICYSRSNTCKMYPLEHNDKGFKYKDEFFEDRGYYKLNQTLDYDSLQYSKSLDYPIEIEGTTLYPGGDVEAYNERQKGNHDQADWAWRWSPELYKFGKKNGFIVFKKSKHGARIYTKTYQRASIEEDDNGKYFIALGDRAKSLSTLELTDNIYSNDNAAKDLATTVGKKTFEYSKPVALVSLICSLCLRENDIIVDFFSGSATTAESVMQFNSETGNSCNYILVQIQENISPEKSAYKAGYRTIDEIGRKRIELAAQKIRDEKPLFHGDLGFKHYTLKEPEAQSLDKMEQFDPKTDGIIEHSLLQEFGKPTVLETWLVRDGYGFSAPVQELDLAGYKGYHCKKHLYLLDHDFTKDVLQALITKLETDGAFNPEEIVLFGYNFTWGQLETLRMNLGRVQASKNLKVNVDVRY